MSTSLISDYPEIKMWINKINSKIDSTWDFVVLLFWYSCVWVILFFFFPGERGSKASNIQNTVLNPDRCIPTSAREAIKLFRGHICNMLEIHFSTLRKWSWITFVLIFIMLVISEYKGVIRSDQTKYRFLVTKSYLTHYMWDFMPFTLMRLVYWKKDQYTLFYNF